MASKSFVKNSKAHKICKNVCLRNHNSVSGTANPVGITANPSAKWQILSESRQIRQRNRKFCRNYGKSVCGIANPVGITANPSAEPQIHQKNDFADGKTPKTSKKGAFPSLLPFRLRKRGTKQPLSLFRIKYQRFQ